jgi:hypothetical protein
MRFAGGHNFFGARRGGQDEIGQNKTLIKTGAHQWMNWLSITHFGEQRK